MNYQKPVLRDYQTEAVNAIEEQFKSHRSTMVVMATGLGKTQVFCEIAKRCTGRVLILAHRAELVDQAKHRIDDLTSEWASIDRASEQANLDAKIVVGSVQTVQRDSRLKRYPRDHFDLIIADEVHHYVSRTFKKPLDYFEHAKLLGVTATPDRLDKRGMGEIFTSVAYRMDILDGINRGYLVPLKGKLVRIEEIDLSNVGRSQGDLNVGELDTTIFKAVEGIIQTVMKEAGDKQAIIFFPGVASAEFARDRMNHLKPDCAAFVGAKTQAYERSNIVHMFKTERIQYLCNCQVATEGFDAPSVSIIAIARPTLSRALYTQMVGRGVRPYNMPEGMGDIERKAFISTSPKPECLILDFVGNSGKYSLMSPANVLGHGVYTDEEIKKAKEIYEEEEFSDEEDVTDMLERAKRELEMLKKAEAARVKAQSESFDPFAVLNIKHDIQSVEFGFEPMTPRQKSALIKFGIAQNDVLGYSKRRAKKVLDALFQRKKLNLASYKQLNWLRQCGYNNPSISFTRAKQAMDVIADSGWNRHNVDRKKLDEVMTSRRNK